MQIILRITVAVIQIAFLIFGFYFILRGIEISDWAKSAMHEIYAANTYTTGAVLIGFFALLCIASRIATAVEDNKNIAESQRESMAKLLIRLKEEIIMDAGLTSSQKTDRE